MVNVILTRVLILIILYPVGSGFLLLPGTGKRGNISWPQKLRPAIIDKYVERNTVEVHPTSIVYVI